MERTYQTIKWAETTGYTKHTHYEIVDYVIRDSYGTLFKHMLELTPSYNIKLNAHSVKNLLKRRWLLFSNHFYFFIYKLIKIKYNQHIALKRSSIYGNFLASHQLVEG